jgi:hypothetical protein
MMDATVRRLARVACSSFMKDADATPHGVMPRPRRYELLPAGIILSVAGFASTCGVPATTVSLPP